MIKSGTRLFALLILLALAACGENPQTETASLETEGLPVQFSGQISGQVGETFDTTIKLPLGATNLKISISGGTGDADLYIHYGDTVPNDTDKFNRIVDHVRGNNETFEEAEPATGNYFIVVSADEDYRNVELKVSYQTDQNPSRFNITLAFDPSLTNTYVKDLVRESAKLWESVITGDIADIASLTKPAQSCGDTIDPAMTNEQIDDVLIFVTVRSLDGPGGLIAQGGTCFTRTTGSLPIVSTISIDSADVVRSFNPRNAVHHELGHALGIGTLWGLKGLVNFTQAQLISGQCGGDPLYKGLNAVREWKELRKTLTGNLSKQDAIPVEELRVGLAACGHWDEAVFDTELMTPFLETSNRSEPLSRLTIASLADLGYTVHYSPAQSYKLPTCSPRCDTISSSLNLPSGLSLQSLEPNHEHSPHIHAPLIYPVGTVDEQGQIVPFEEQ